jgi:hypothetical protein
MILLLASACSGTDNAADRKPPKLEAEPSPSPTLDPETVERVNDICRGAEEKILDVGTDLIPSARAPESLIVDPASSVSYATDLTKLYLEIIGRVVHAGQDLPLPIEELAEFAATETQLMLDYANKLEAGEMDFQLINQLERVGSETHEFAQTELTPLTGCWDLSVWKPSSCVWLAEGGRLSGCFGIYEASGEEVEIREKDRDE